MSDEVVDFSSVFAQKFTTNHLLAQKASIRELDYQNSGVVGDFTVNGNLTVAENVTIGGKIEQSSSTASNSLGFTTITDLTVTGPLNVAGNFSIEDLTVSGSTSLNTLVQTEGTSNLAATTITGPCSIEGAATISGTTILVNSTLAANGGITQTGVQANQLKDTIIDGDLNVIEKCSSSNLIVNGNASIVGGLQITGPISQTSASSNSLSSTTINGLLSCSGFSQTGNLTVNGYTSVNGDVVTTSATSAGTFTVSDSSILKDVSVETLNVSGTVDGSLNVVDTLYATAGSFGTFSSGSVESKGVINMASTSYISQTSSSSTNQLFSTKVNGTSTISGSLTISGSGVTFPDGSVQSTAAVPGKTWYYTTINKNVGTSTTELLLINEPFTGSSTWKLECNVVYQNTGGGTANITTTMGYSTGNVYSTISIPSGQYKTVSMIHYVYAPVGQNAGAMALYGAISSGSAVATSARFFVTRVGDFTYSSN